MLWVPKMDYDFSTMPLPIDNFTWIKQTSKADSKNRFNTLIHSNRHINLEVNE